MQENDFPKVYSKVTNWWYHYYSVGLDEEIKEVSKEQFLLHPCKFTPDFSNYTYNYGICHFQIGYDVVPGKSIIFLKTTIGKKNAPSGFIEKSQYVTGYFRVYAINRDEEYIVMDKEDSLLLLDDPIKIDVNWAKKLFPEKDKDYWEASNLVQKIGSMTRNRHIKGREAKMLLEELIKRKRKGSKNYLGPKYNDVCFKSTGRITD